MKKTLFLTLILLSCICCRKKYKCVCNNYVFSDTGDSTYLFGKGTRSGYIRIKSKAYRECNGSSGIYEDEVYGLTDRRCVLHIE